ncbi:RNA-binding protein 7 [Cotesia glomerata]|uniref:RRM domain-containing protein n=1 Tax=Cotesia glomerata TaxID=32391 RepID=A0AAV7HFD8_COTGL|nr:RNA-binding protein 7 [Cotesia glomerata]KAH0535513.1 hypothetical protein KQX54_016919 [Cotesia glomerata]
MDEDSRTIWCGNLSNKCTEDLLYELFIQAGPLEKVNIPKDRDGSQKSFGFVTFKHMVSVPYALNLFEGTTLFNRALMLKNRQVNDPKGVMNKFNNDNVLQFGNQPLENSMAYNIARNMLPMFTPPGMGMYPSQMNNFPSKDDNRRGRSHPYNRDRERERDRDRQDRSHRNQHHKNDHRNQRHYHNRSRNTR